jgi:hypothetical protein
VEDSSRIRRVVAMKASAVLALTTAAVLSTACTAPAPELGTPPQGLVGEPTAAAPASGSHAGGQVPCAMVQPSGGAGELCDLPPGSGITFTP